MVKSNIKATKSIKIDTQELHCGDLKALDLAQATNDVVVVDHDGLLGSATGVDGCGRFEVQTRAIEAGVERPVPDAAPVLVDEAVQYHLQNYRLAVVFPQLLVI